MKCALHMRVFVCFFAYQVINVPSKSDIDAIQSVYTATMLESLPPMNYKLLGDVFPQASSEAIDLIRSCFHFNPNKRPSAEELLKVSGEMYTNKYALFFFQF